MTTLLLVLSAVLLVPFEVPQPRAVWEESLGLKAPKEHPEVASRLQVLRLMGSAGVGLAVIWFIGGLVGVVLCVPAMLLAWRSLSSNSRDIRNDQLRIARALPDAVVLLSALIRAGLPDEVALGLVGSATSDPLGKQLSSVARARALGQDVVRAWSSMMVLSETSALADAMVRSAQSGAPVGELLARVAADARRDHYTMAQAAARAAGVRVVLPLGLCYLPSFLLLAVVPIVAALSGDLGW